MSDTIRDYHDTESIVDEVACRLNETEAAERADWVEAEVVPHLSGVDELDDGFVLRFPNTDEVLESVVTMVVLESRCCADETFTLDVPADAEQLTLTVTGPAGTKELARQGFIERFEDVPEPA